MNKQKFEKYLDERLKLIKDTLIHKRAEYATDESVFANFEKASKITGDAPEKIMFNYMLKHWISYLDIVKKLNEHPNANFGSEFINEKFGDIINYFILSEIYIIEHRCFDKNLPF